MALAVKNPPANPGDAGDAVLIPGSGRYHGEGNGNPLQCSCLKSSMDRGAWQTTVHGTAKNRTWLSNWTHTHKDNTIEIQSTVIFFLSLLCVNLYTYRTLHTVELTHDIRMISELSLINWYFLERLYPWLVNCNPESHLLFLLMVFFHNLCLFFVLFCFNLTQLWGWNKLRSWTFMIHGFKGILKGLILNINWLKDLYVKVLSAALHEENIPSCDGLKSCLILSA